jgi:hypothetical protein
MRSLFPTQQELDEATWEEKLLWAKLFLRECEQNYADQLAADIRFDHSEEMREWVDEYTTIGDDAERIRQAGRMTVVRNRGTKSMNTPARTIKGDIVESVIMKGDLSRLTPAERVEYYSRVCQSIGLNPLTQPFAYMTLNGKMTLYAKRDAADQLRKINGISIEIVSREVVDGIYTVHVRAKDPLGRTDEDFGVVAIPDALKGEARANAILKAVTKAKRRVTLSISGLGLMDETEVEDVPGARQEPSVAHADSGAIEEAAASQASPPLSESAAATDEFPADSTARFVAECRDRIGPMKTYTEAVKWWNQNSEIKKRQDFALSATQIEELKNLILAKKIGPQ